MIDQWFLFKSKMWKEGAIDLWYVQSCKLEWNFWRRISVKINVKYNFFFKLNFKECIDTWKMDNIKEFEYTELKIREFRN